MNTKDLAILEILKELSRHLGYHFEKNMDGSEERMIRPDGTCALIARTIQPSAGIDDLAAVTDGIAPHGVDEGW